ncbi:similar to CELLULOSE SYNTHASE INTERACTIVE 3 [Actinidia rufa]|uniref:Similar to CELLULOSE SYNTHASE INTERACTIVE 3 n=1 Tax=Actinidia rufa TaxID=165716 RepID=A0A7J0DQ91_9ERIC|nr:similar to CELLULOSE SYNTHASE INTERACTIVE 3 [Actinidia rufa]
MSKSPSPGPRESISSSPSQPRDSNGTKEMDDPDKTMDTVARFVEQLHANMSSPHEKELITARLLGIARARKEARTLIGSHAQAMPLFISILRSGTHLAKVNVAATLSVLCKDEELRLKVLLGGCIPPLLSLLKSESTELRKAAAEAIYEVSSGGLSDDHVGMKIFVTEGVVPTLWEMLNPKHKQDKVVEGFITGALRNLCGDKDGYWRATLEAGGVDIIVGLLSLGNAAVQSNAASLLARLILAFSDSIPKVIDSGAVKALLGLVGQENDISVRASAADALEALSSKSTRAKKTVVDADGVPVLIGAIVAPSKECMKGEGGHALQGHATRALANICGGMSALMLYLGELSQSPRLAAPVADIIGALAYALMVFEQQSGVEEESFNATQIEDILVTLLKPRDNKLVQERVLEAMACLYGNTYLSRWLNQAEAKKVLIGLTTMAAADVQEYLILSLISFCCDGQMGNHSSWRDTSSYREAREDAAHVLWNLCCHSEDIRACVESAGAVPAFLWLLKSGGPKGQEASAKALTKLIRTADSATINQLLALLLGDSPSSKTHIIRVLGHVLTMASQSDIVHKGAAANKGLRSLVQVLNSSNEETQEHAASVLADLFSNRQDICDSLAIDEVVHPCMKLLTSNTQVIATQSARALGALSRPTKTKSSNRMSYIAEGDVKPLIKLAKTSSIDAAETAVAALANLLSDPQIAAEALSEDVVSALTRVLGEGTPEGKKNASRALYQLLRHFPVGDVLKSNAQCRFAVLSIVDSFNAMDMDGTDAAAALEVVALLARTKQSVNSTYLPWSALAEVPSSLEPLVRCLAEGPPLVQDKAIEILSRLCGDQTVVLGDLLVAKSGSIGGLANRIMNSNSLEVRVGGTALLICAAKEHKIQSMDALDGSGYLKPLIYALVDMMKRNSSCCSLEIEVRTPRGFVERTAFQDEDEFEVPDPATVLGGTVALWLLSIISSFHVKNKLTVVEAGALETLSDKLVNYTSNPQGEFEDTEGIWISALLLSILFQDAKYCVISGCNAYHTLACTSAELVLLHAKTIPLLVDLLRPMPDRPGAPPTAVRLLTQIADGSDTNKLLMAEAGALDALTKYLSLSPQEDLTEATISELLRILFSNPDLLRYEASVSSLNQLIAVLRLGSRSARLSAARALHVLFDAENIRDSELAKQAVQPLVDMLEAASESEQHTALIGLIKLTSGNSSKAVLMTDVEGNPLESLYKILSSSNSLELKTNAAQLCFVLFGNPKLRAMPIASECMEPLISLIQSDMSTAVESGVCAFERLLDEEQQVEFAAAYDIVELLVGLVSGSNSRLIEASICALIKLGKDRTPRKLDMVKAGIIDNCLELLPTASSALSSSIAELLRILTNSSAISKSSGIGILNLQQTAIKSLENISLSWPKAVADAGGIFELAKVIIQDDPQPPHALWESAALVLSNVLRSNADYYFKVPLVVLVKMLHSTHESTVTVALNALIVQESSDASSAELMTEAGAIDALLDLLRSHTCEEASGRLLEALFNNVRVREMKVSKYAIAPLAQYLLDPQTRSQSGKLLAALALGDLSQREGLARASDSVSACRALISLLEDQPTEEMQMVAICALQNFVMHSRTNRRAVAEAGGILVIQELLVSPNPEAVGQAALLIKFLFSNHTLQEYVSNELIRSLTAALEKELWSSSTVNEDVLRTIHVIFTNFPKLHISEAATLCIPNLVAALKSGSDAAQDSVLDTLCLLKHSWSTMPIDISKSQSMIASEAIPILQMLVKTCPPSFHDRADSLLHCLPGCLTVTIKRGSNLKQVMGGTNAFCRLTIGNGPPRQTKVVSNSTSPEWKEGFTWAFDVPPKGQKLHILCKSKSTFGKTSLGRVTIQIDKVVSEGVYSGLFSLNHDSNKDGTSRTLEIEINWSNRISNESV